MKQKIGFIQAMSAVFLSLSLSSCSAVEGIFKTGFNVGIFVAILVVVVIIFVIARLGKKS